MKNQIKHLIFTGVLLSTMLLYFGSCRCKPEICHHYVYFVNNSDSTISVCKLASSIAYACLPKIAEVKPHDTIEIEESKRYCLEEVLPYEREHTLFILPESYTLAHTTIDSLEIAYNILKTINLVELGPDSLLKTNYTVYYP